MDTQILEDFGLTHAEIKTYLALLELGSATAGPLLEKSGLQNSVVHRALNSLIEKGLINYVKEGKRNIYQATDPEQFRNYIEDKRQRFEQLLPELKTKQIGAHVKESATIYKGIRGVKEVYNLMISQKAKEYLTYGGGKECVARMGLAWWINLHASRVANKLPSRQVFDESVRSQDADIVGKPLTNVRYVSSELAQFQETVIVGDTVAVTVFTQNPYSFLIHDAKVAEGYKKYFELLWSVAQT